MLAIGLLGAEVSGSPTLYYKDLGAAFWYAGKWRQSVCSETVHTQVEWFQKTIPYPERWWWSCRGAAGWNPFSASPTLQPRLRKAWSVKSSYSLRIFLRITHELKPQGAWRLLVLGKGWEKRRLDCGLLILESVKCLPKIQLYELWKHRKLLCLSHSQSLQSNNPHLSFFSTPSLQMFLC